MARLNIGPGRTARASLRHQLRHTANVSNDKKFLRDPRNPWEAPTLSILQHHILSIIF